MTMAVVGGAQAPGLPWSQMEAVCRAAVGVGAGRRAVAALVSALKQTGEAGAPDGLAERLAELVCSPKSKGETRDPDWLTLMAKTHKVDDLELRAAREILYVLRLRIETSGGAIRAVDTTRLVVDGGRLVGARLAGMPLDPSVERFDRWVEEVKGLAQPQRLVRGRVKSLSLFALVQRVLVCGDGPNLIDKEVGVRNGRCGEVVRRELKRYVDRNFRP